MIYVRNAWYVASWTQDLETEKPFAINILGEPIVVWRNKQGALAALENRCAHRLAPLSLGRCEGERLRCMYHGFLYEKDGRVCEIPGQDVIPANAKVKNYPVAEKHSWIWVWMGDPGKANEALIPPAIGFDDPDYILGKGHLDYAAEARLISDNLCDFSHLTFVHANSFGAGVDFANAAPAITALERGVRFSRWITGTPGPAGRRTGELFDNWSSYDYLLPGVLLMWSGSFARGYAQACNFDPPKNLGDAVNGVTFTSQAVTPMTQKTSRYFFSWGPHVNHGDAKLRDALMRVAAQAFAEDKAMIEAQQTVIDRTDNARIVPTVHDRGVTMFNRLVERLAKEEGTVKASAAERRRCLVFFHARRTFARRIPAPVFSRDRMRIVKRHDPRFGPHARR